MGLLSVKICFSTALYDLKRLCQYNFSTGCLDVFAFLKAVCVLSNAINANRKREHIHVDKPSLQFTLLKHVQNNWSKLYLVSWGWQLILKVVKQIWIYCWAQLPRQQMPRAFLSSPLPCWSSLPLLFLLLFLTEILSCSFFAQISTSKILCAQLLLPFSPANPLFLFVFYRNHQISTSLPLLFLKSQLNSKKYCLPKRYKIQNTVCPIVVKYKIPFAQLLLLNNYSCSSKSLPPHFMPGALAY